MTAEQLGGQKIFLRCFVPRGSLLVAGKPALYPFENFRFNDSGDTIGDHHITIFILTDIFSVVEDNTDTADGKFLSLFGADTTKIQHFLDLRHGLSAVIPGEDFLYHQYHFRIRHQNTLFTNHITNRDIATVAFTLHGVVMLTPLDFLGKLCGIVFGISFQHGFQNDALRPIRNVFLGGDDLDTVPLQNPLVVGAVIAVTGEAVKLPHNHNIEQTLFAVSDHLLECGTVGGSSRQCPVNIVVKNENIIPIGIIGTFPNLTFDRFLSLAVRGIPGIDDCFHAVSLLSSVSSCRSRIPTLIPSTKPDRL